MLGQERKQLNIPLKSFSRWEYFPSFKNLFLACQHGISGMTLALPCAVMCSTVLTHADYEEKGRQSKNYCCYYISIRTFSLSDLYFVCMFPVCIYLVVEIYICTPSSRESHMFNCKISILGESLALMPLTLHRDDPRHCCGCLQSGVRATLFILWPPRKDFFSVAECLPLHR